MSFKLMTYLGLVWTMGCWLTSVERERTSEPSCSWIENDSISQICSTHPYCYKHLGPKKPFLRWVCYWNFETEIFREPHWLGWIESGRRRTNEKSIYWISYFLNRLIKYLPLSLIVSGTLYDPLEVSLNKLFTVLELKASRLELEE
jgi:hypothetical protein